MVAAALEVGHIDDMPDDGPQRNWVGWVPSNAWVLESDVPSNTCVLESEGSGWGQGFAAAVLVSWIPPAFVGADS